MANVTKLKRDEMIKFLEELKNTHTDDSSIRAFNEIENALTEKKFGLVFEEHTEEVDERLLNEIPVFCADETRKICKDKNLPYNFIIEGDNLQALYLLEKTHRGKIDCIYIDPPYNTGAKDWKYNNAYADINDLYRHSKWLSMMSSRLKLAKRLLSKDGALICAIDENELNTLGLLLQEIFSNKYYIDCIAIVHNPGGIQGANFSYCHEYAYFVYPQKSYYIQKERRKEGELTPFRDWGKENSKRKGSPNCFFPILVQDNKIIGFGNVPEDDYHPESANVNVDGITYVWPIDKNGIERRWRFARDTVESIAEELVVVPIRNVLNIQRQKQFYTRKTLWNEAKYSANIYGTQLLSQIIGSRFSFPKSLYLVKDCIETCLQKKDAIVLDFFAGSGTTLHAVNLMNAEDNGNRKCILVTNNEISNEEEKQFTKQGLKKGDDDWEKHGIAKYVTYERTKCTINGININGEPLKGNYLGSNLPMSDGFNANVKYFKCDWIPRKPQDYLLSNILCLHVKEMIELEHAIEIDNEKNVIIFNKDDFNDYILNNEKYEKIENLWVNQNVIFTSDELKLLSKKDFKYIPREYFGQELKEAAE